MSSDCLLSPGPSETEHPHFAAPGPWFVKTLPGSHSTTPFVEQPFLARDFSEGLQPPVPIQINTAVGYRPSGPGFSAKLTDPLETPIPTPTPGAHRSSPACSVQAQPCESRLAHLPLPEPPREMPPEASPTDHDAKALALVSEQGTQRVRPGVTGPSPFLHTHGCRASWVGLRTLRISGEKVKCVLSMLALVPCIHVLFCFVFQMREGLLSMRRFGRTGRQQVSVIRLLPIPQSCLKGLDLIALSASMGQSEEWASIVGISRGPQTHDEN